MENNANHSAHERTTRLETDMCWVKKHLQGMGEELTALRQLILPLSMQATRRHRMTVNALSSAAGGAVTAFLTLLLTKLFD